MRSWSSVPLGTLWRQRMRLRIALLTQEETSAHQCLLTPTGHIVPRGQGTFHFKVCTCTRMAKGSLVSSTPPGEKSAPDQKAGGARASGGLVVSGQLCAQLAAEQIRARRMWDGTCKTFNTKKGQLNITASPSDHKCAFIRASISNANSHFYPKWLKSLQVQQTYPSYKLFKEPSLVWTIVNTFETLKLLQEYSHEDFFLGFLLKTLCNAFIFFQTHVS